MKAQKFSLFVVAALACINLSACNHTVKIEGSIAKGRTQPQQDSAGHNHGNTDAYIAKGRPEPSPYSAEHNHGNAQS